MGKKNHHGAEDIIRKLRQADVLASQGKTVAELCRELGVSDATYYKWRKEYGGMGVEQAKRLKELERENDRLKRAVAELTLDKLILKEAASGNCPAPILRSSFKLVGLRNISRLPYAAYPARNTASC